MNFLDARIAVGSGLVIQNFTFISQTDLQSEGSSIKISGAHSIAGGISSLLSSKDANIEENRSFCYHVLMPEGVHKARGVIIMLHGLNEKEWTKYMPWAAYLATQTGKSVVLFPLAFHMNRAPALWADPRSMFSISQNRKKMYPGIVASTSANAALSDRLHNKPERFVFSGMESYKNIIALVRDIKHGGHPAIQANAQIDFFTYSIGSFLGEILMMSNRNGYFSNSRLVAFCGGPVLEHLSPVSKFILDSQASKGLASYFIDNLNTHEALEEKFKRLFADTPEEGMNFYSLLSYGVNKAHRERKFHELSQRIYGIALTKDTVAVPVRVRETLQGSYGNTGIKVDVLDYPYAYRHENPFPETASIAKNVDVQFQKTFHLASTFLQTKAADGSSLSPS